MPTVNIAGIDKPALLAALYDRAPVLGLGALHATPGPLSPEDAAALVVKHTYVSGDRTSTYFDYVNGRCMKVDIGGDELETRAYDRDAGAGMGERVVAALRAKAPLPGQPTAVPLRPADPEAFVAAHDFEIVVLNIP